MHTEQAVDIDNKGQIKDNINPNDSVVAPESKTDTVSTQTDHETPKTTEVVEEKSGQVPDTISAAVSDIKVPEESKEEPIVALDQPDKISQLENRITLLETKLSDIMSQFKAITTITKPIEPQDIVKEAPVIEPKDKVYVPYIYSNRFTTIDNQTTLHDNALQMKVTLASLMENNENDKLYPFGDETITMKFPMQILIYGSRMTNLLVQSKEFCNWKMTNMS